MPATLIAIHVYPVKGCRGLSPSAARACARGFAGDRRWMIVDADGRFVSQRTEPRLATIAADPRGRALILRAPHAGELVVPLSRDGGPAAAGDGERDVQIWRDTVAARDAGDEAAAWLGAALGGPARLVFMPDATVRRVDAGHGAPGDSVSFADAFPYLLISEGALADLNARLPRALPMDRFRPNLVVTGCPPFAEDRWRRVRIGRVTFRVVKPCTRCAVTTVDQRTGVPDGPEPLRTLATYRRRDDGVAFGMNLVPDDEGELRVGDPVVPQP